jgi:DNA-binding MarR family transcriptional regulator
MLKRYPGQMTAEVARDRADVLVDLLSQRVPDTDAATKKLGLRLRRLANHLERELRKELAAAGIETWELEALLTLHSAPQQRSTAGALLRGSQVTAGAISNRIARMEAQGWVKRDVDPGDRRQVLVTLTPAGQRRTEQILALNTTAEQRLLGRVDADSIERMSRDLRELLLRIEGPAAEQDAYEACVEAATTERSGT